MSGECILIIDDSPEIVKHLTEHVLTPRGYHQIHAYDGKAGLRQMRERQPDLVMLDFNLPEMSGIDVLQQMASDSISIPVIVMTGYGSELSAIEAFRLGAKDYLIKPFTQAEILEAIDRALVEKRLQDDKADLSEQLRRTKVALGRQAQEMQTLAQIGKAITSLLSMDKVLQRVLDAAAQLTGAQESAIWLPDETQTHLQMYYKSASETAATPVTVAELALADSMAGKVLRTGQALRKSRFTGHGIQAKSDAYVRALLYVPLKLRGVTMGVLGVSNPTLLQSFSHRDEFLLAFLADYSAIALENARVVQATDHALAKNLEELNTLIEITRTITASLDMDEIMRLTIQQIQQSWNVEAASVWLLDRQNAVLRVLANAGTPREVLADVEVPLGVGFVGQVVETGRWQYSNDVATHPLHYREVDQHTGFKTHSLLCVPLRFRDEVLGAMQLLNKQDGDFDDMDVERALAIATAVAIAVTNANLFEASEAQQRAHEDFVATISHDMRVPLSTMIGFTEVFEEAGPLTTEQTLYLKHIRKASARMMHLVDGLLDLASANIQLATRPYAPFKIADVAARVVDDWRSEALARGVQLTFEREKDAACTVLGDAEQVERALGNLIDNGIKYSGGAAKVAVRLTCQDRTALISVRDWGLGIPAAELPHIFDKFYRGSIGSQQEGSGLGLALVKSVAKAHGGSVWAESDLETGSIVGMRLPCTEQAPCASANGG